VLAVRVQVGDADILAVINKLAKQRKDSIEQYTAGGRIEQYIAIHSSTQQAGA
jgi:uncharacterized protein YqeY